MWDDEVVEAIFREAELGIAGAQLALARAYSSGSLIKGIQFPTDYEKALHYYALAADQGNPAALNELALMYEQGKGVSADPNKAREFLVLAADAGDPFGQRNLARFFLNGIAIARDVQRAFELYLASAKQGNQWSQFQVALMYSKGQGVKRDEPEASSWLRAAAEQGHARAAFLLARRYFDGQGVERDEDQGCYYLYQAADQGDLDAQGELANLFYLGEGGVAKDESKAFDWARKAAEKGHAPSMVYVARALRDGSGVDPDPSAAVRWYEKLAVLPEQSVHEIGQRDLYSILSRSICLPDQANIELGVMYLSPKFDVVNAKRGEECLVEAWNEGGWIAAALELGKAYLYGYALPKSEIIAFEWFKRAYDSTIENGLAVFEEEVCGWLAYCYETGVGAQKDTQMAFAIYKPGADRGEQWAQLKLAIYFESGQGVARDYQQAYFWANIAASKGGEKACELRDRLESKLTKSQIAESQRWSAKWKPATS